MTTTQVALAALDGGGKPITLRGDQNTDNSVAMRASLEIEGAAVSATNPLPVTTVPSALSNSAAGTMTTAAEIVVPYSATRKWLAISNRTTGVEVQDIGSANVVVGSGIPIQPNQTFTFTGVGAAGPIYGITTVVGSAFSYVEG